MTSDLSGGGLSFAAQAPLNPGTRISAALSLPGREQPIPLIAEVLCSEQSYVMGTAASERRIEVEVRFVSIAPGDQDDIKRYIIAGLQAPPQP